MTTPPLPAAWTDDHSLALILLSISAIDGDIATDELAEVGKHLAALRGATPSASVDITQDAYEYLVTITQSLADDGDLVHTVRAHCERLTDVLSAQQKHNVLQAVTAICQADGRVDLTEVRAYEMVSETWDLG